jgi:hypothetical protein
MVAAANPVAPPGSVTRRLAVYVPTPYTKLRVGVVPSSYPPSPSRSQAYVSAPPSGSLEPVELKATVSGAWPLVGLAPMTATGGRLAGAP